MGLCEGNLQVGSFTGDPGEYVKKSLKTGSSLHRGPFGEPGRGVRLPGTLGDSKRDLLMERLSVRDLCERTLEVGLLYREPEGYLKNGSGNGHLHRDLVGETGRGGLV